MKVHNTPTMFITKREEALHCLTQIKWINNNTSSCTER